MVRSHCRGFTLVEVMVVVFIILMLFAIAAPNFLNTRSLSRAQTVCSDLRQISTAKNQFIMVRSLKAGDPVNDGADLVPTYMNSWPTGPVTGSYSANVVGAEPTFNGQDAAWYKQHCTGTTADSLCPL